VPSNNFKHCSINLTEVTIWGDQEEENDFIVPWEHFKHFL